MRDRMTPLDASMANEYELEDAMLDGDLFAEAELRERENEQWQREQEERLLLDEMESSPEEYSDQKSYDHISWCEDCGEITLLGLCFNSDCSSADLCPECGNFLTQGSCWSEDCEKHVED